MDQAAVPKRHFQVAPQDPAAFTTHRMGALRHDFHLHPLMELPQLSRLAKDLFPTKQCRFVKPGLQQASAFVHQETPSDGRDIDEIFSRIEEPGSWIALYNVETDPLYKGFLDEVMATAGPLVEREQPGIFNLGGFIFISAPPSVTPFHIDRENNFWLQVRGHKTMQVWDCTDREVIAGPDVDHFIMYGGLDNIRLKEGHASRAREFAVGPGDGVYFPSTSPHATVCDRSWVKPGDGVSISIGVVFYTQHTRRMAHAHTMNWYLRRLGLSPTYPGVSPWRDAVKFPASRAIVWARKTFRGYKPSVSL